MAFGVAEILNQWQEVGIFDFVLPFLLIFCIVFGILEATNILGRNKGIHSVISIVIGLLALQLNFVQTFFQELFPRLAVGLAVIVALLILVGLFINSDETRYWLYGLAAISVVVWIIIITKTFQGVGWFGDYFTQEYIGLIIGAVLLLGVIIVVVSSNSTGGKPGTAERKVFQNSG